MTNKRIIKFKGRSIEASQTDKQRGQKWKKNIRIEHPRPVSLWDSLKMCDIYIIKLPVEVIKEPKKRLK